MKYLVTVHRIETREATITVEANNDLEACDLALDKAGDLFFYSIGKLVDCEYEVMNAEEEHHGS